MPSQRLGGFALEDMYGDVDVDWNRQCVNLDQLNSYMRNEQNILGIFLKPGLPLRLSAEAGKILGPIYRAYNFRIEDDSPSPQCCAECFCSDLRGQEKV